MNRTDILAALTAFEISHTEVMNKIVTSDYPNVRTALDAFLIGYVPVASKLVISPDEIPAPMFPIIPVTILQGAVKATYKRVPPTLMPLVKSGEPGVSEGDTLTLERDGKVMRFVVMADGQLRTEDGKTFYRPAVATGWARYGKEGKSEGGWSILKTRYGKTVKEVAEASGLYEYGKGEHRARMQFAANWKAVARAHRVRRHLAPLSELAN